MSRRGRGPSRTWSLGAIGVLVAISVVVGGGCNPSGGATSSTAAVPPSSPATVPPATSVVAVPPTALPAVARWALDEPPGSRILVDVTGSGLDGVIGANVQVGLVTGGATGHRFPDVDHDAAPRDPLRLDVVPADPRLDPADADHAIEVRLRTTRLDGNIVQKGQWHTPGGYFKLDMDDGRAWCTYHGSSAEVVARSPRVNDGAWRTVRCERRSDEVLLFVNGELVDRRPGATGTIRNSAPLAIGGKQECDRTDSGCDYFSGDLDHVAVESGR